MPTMTSGENALYRDWRVHDPILSHKLEQPFRSYCHKNLGIFVYNPMGGVQLGVVIEVDETKAKVFTGYLRLLR